MSWTHLRHRVLKRDNFTCQICLEQDKKLETNHIIPRRKQGLDSINNLVTVCRNCHELIELSPISKNIRTRIVIFNCEASEVKRLKRIALENDQTLNALLLEGVRYILNKYEGKSKK